MTRFKAANIWPLKATTLSFNSSKFIQYFNQQYPNHRVYDSEKKFTASKFNAKNVNTVKRNRIFGNINHSN